MHLNYLLIIVASFCIWLCWSDIVEFIKSIRVKANLFLLLNSNRTEVAIDKDVLLASYSFGFWSILTTITPEECTLSTKKLFDIDCSDFREQLISLVEKRYKSGKFLNMMEDVYD